jgi:Kef-type K+ transport system membrane component KefB
MKQPVVMGEIIAGIALGPSLLGTALPDASNFLFPAASLGNLQMLSQVGLILFMFVIGMELDLSIIRNKAKTAFTISYASIIIPFVLGIGLAWLLKDKYLPGGIEFYVFALFMGIALSITAFPVLARVIKERGLSHSKLGIMALTSAAVDDVTGWSLLAFVIAIAKAEGMETPLYILAGTVVYVAAMLFIVRPFLKKLSQKQINVAIIKQSTIAIIFITLLLSALCCEVIGIHALFGAFMAGIVMPLEWSFRKQIIDKIEDVALVLLLPLFFVLTGLRTEIGLINEASQWLMCGFIILLAIAGKFGGSYIAARFTGEDNYNSLAIGILMNTRGLMELVVLNIGYDLGILTPEIFTMMVVMALVTTLMTNPLLNLTDRIYNKGRFSAAAE